MGHFLQLPAHLDEPLRHSQHTCHFILRWGFQGDACDIVYRGSAADLGEKASIAEHPIGLLADLRFRVTVNTDNRLMSGTTMTQEMSAVSEAFGWGVGDLRWLTVNAMKSAFIPFDQRLALIDDVIKPAYAAAGA